MGSEKSWKIVENVFIENAPIKKKSAKI